MGVSRGRGVWEGGFLGEGELGEGVLGRECLGEGVGGEEENQKKPIGVGMKHKFGNNPGAAGTMV